MPGVLDGIKVFDLTLAVVGPWASKLLGQLGAEVWKVEDPEGELTHYVPPFMAGASAVYIDSNLNKTLRPLDLKDDAGRAEAWKLAEQADVFVENMRPGAVDRLGFSYEEVSARNPGIIYVSACAYGRVGPMATQAGVDPLVQAFSGWSSLTGPEGSPGEMVRYLVHLDITTGSMIVEAVLAALIARERTGRGQKIEIEMLGAALSAQTTRLAEYFATGVQPAPLGSASATVVPHQAFRCADGEWLAVGVVEESQWLPFCRAVGLGEAAGDARFAINADRVAHRAELVALIEERLAAAPSTWWELQFERAGVPAGRFLRFWDLRHHAQVAANEFMGDIETPFGPLTVEGVPWRLSENPAGPVAYGAGRTRPGRKVAS